ncbi:MAG TPA: hypothetical protein VHR66_15660 [Gemmataceae bacterium]|jgi:hypothetical protein|nr:hypothetical protein [Gemmataceae bacterium]
MVGDPMLTIKGRSPRGLYAVKLTDIFFADQHQVLTRSAADESLRKIKLLGQPVNCELLDEVFPPKAFQDRRHVSRFPCVMKDAPEDKVRLNLLYQDTRLKLGFEDAMARRNDRKPGACDIAALLRIYLVLLRTLLWGCEPTWRLCTDNDLDALTFSLLNRFDPARRDDLLRDGYLANRHSLLAVKSLLEGEDQSPLSFLPYQIHAGAVWWSDPHGHRVPDAELILNDFECFSVEALSCPSRLVFLFDDNGELAWDLVMIRLMLCANPGLTVTGVVSTEVVANNSNSATLATCLEDPLLGSLRNDPRFEVFEERNIRSAIDPAFCSRELLGVMSNADVLFIKGVSFFETIQRLDAPSYYGFVVHSLDSQRCTGLRKGEGVFVRIPRHKAAFDYGNKALRELYPGLRASFRVPIP